MGQIKIKTKTTNTTKWTKFITNRTNLKWESQNKSIPPRGNLRIESRKKKSNFFEEKLNNKIAKKYLMIYIVLLLIKLIYPTFRMQ
jgi:hypothetical protein